MKVVTDFPHKVKDIEITIPMSDGTKLAGRLWLPEDAAQNPVPAILEYIPYRKRDHTRSRDEMHMTYYAGHGYAGVRIDIRGSGDSEGVMEDEYTQQELDDGVEIINWLAKQEWCSGKVGMICISWGGFNGLQIAAMAPDPLAAIITICSTDDRYADDVHYMGGCHLGDNLSWASIMFARNSLPPDPQIVGDKWRDMWLERLEGSGLWLQKWLEHQRRDEYWKHGSVCEDFSAIECPVMAVSGWADGYTNSVFRLMNKLDVPRKGLVGPWSHKYPNDGEPGPAIGFLQEVLRWYDKWLKGKETGIMEEPMLRVWMQDSVPPTTSYDNRPGRWVAENAWPSPEIEEKTYGLAPWKLTENSADNNDNILTVKSPLRLGLFAGKWCSYSAPPDLPSDQREEDGGALWFETEPLEEEIEILGAPVVELDIAADKPVAQAAVRLSDIDPEGKATRVTYGILNLTHRKSHEHPEYLEPGKYYKIRIQMNDIAQTFPAGHKLRLSISSSYWPLAWTPPEITKLSIKPENSRFTVPVRKPHPADDKLVDFEEPEAAPGTEETQLTEVEHAWRVHRDLANDISVLEVIKDDGIKHIADVNLDYESRSVEKYSVRDDDINSVRGETEWIRGFKRDEDWNIKTVTKTVITSDKLNFYIKASLDAYEGETRLFCKSWDETIPRDFV